MTVKPKKIGMSLIYHLFVLSFMFAMLYPLLWMLASSFKAPGEIFTNASSLIPSRLIFDNYRDGWRGFGNVSFATFFKNSIFVTVVSVIGQVWMSTMVAYGFARLSFPGKKLFFVLMILTMLLPGQILLIPQYILFMNFGWINSYLPLIVPSYAGTPFFIFLIMQFIQGIPRELDESARIDGCGKIQIFIRIIVPLALPAIATATVFAFYWKWDDFMGPLLYLQNIKMYTVSIALKAFSDPSSVSNWGAMFAMSCLSLLPSFIIFVCFQKYLVEGIATTGLKG